MTQIKMYEKAVEVAKAELLALSTLGFSSTANVMAKEALDKINAILHPETEYEEVEVVRWLCPDCGGIHTDEGKAADGVCCKTPYVKLTGTLRRPKPQKVERSVSVEARVSSTGANGGGYVTSADDKGHYNCIAFYSRPECHGKAGTLTFTWTEEGEGK